MRKTLIFFQLKQLLLFFLLCSALSGNASITQFHVFNEAGKVGLKDESGKILIPAEYEALGWSNGSSEVINERIGYAENGLWGLLSISNNKVTATTYTILYPTNQFFVAAKKGKITRRDFIGLMNRDAKVVIPFQYTSISYHGGYVIAGDADRGSYKYGVLSPSGEQVLPLQYKSVMPLNASGFAVQQDNNTFDIYSSLGKKSILQNLDEVVRISPEFWKIRRGIMQGILNDKLQLYRQLRYSKVKATEDSLILKRHNQWVVFDQSLNARDTVFSETIIPVGQNTYFLSDGQAYQLWKDRKMGKTVNNLRVIKQGVYLYEENGNFALLKNTGESVELPKTDSIRVSNQNLLLRNKLGWSVYDTFGVKKSEAYSEITALNNRFWKVLKHGKWGLLNRSGEEVAWCTYDDIYSIKDNRVTVSFHGTKGIISTNGAWFLNPIKADEIQLVDHDRYFVITDSLTRIYDEDHELIYFTNNEIQPVDSGYVESLKDGGQWRIALDGTIQEDESPYEEIRGISEGYIAIRKNGLYGFIDDRNRLRIANRYDAVGDFHEGLAAFKLIGKWGYLNKREQIVIQPQFLTATNFKNNTAIVSGPNGFGLIDQFGNKRSAFDYDEIMSIPEGFMVTKNRKIGLLDKRGSMKIQARYDQLIPLSSGLVKVEQFGQFGLLDDDGLTQLSIIYDHLIYDEVNNVYLAQKKSSVEKLSLQ